MVRQTSSIRRQQIIEAARGLITNRGMDAVTMDAIAEAVGLSEGAIYRHFSSKHQILLQAFADWIGEAVVRDQQQSFGVRNNDEIRHHAPFDVTVSAEQGAGVVQVVEIRGEIPLQEARSIHPTQAQHREIDQRGAILLRRVGVAQRQGVNTLRVQK